MNLALKTPASFTISKVNLDFLQSFSKKINSSKSALADKVLSEWKRQVLLYEFSKEASLDSKEDLEFVNFDFSDFIKENA